MTSIVTKEISISAELVPIDASDAKRAVIDQVALIEAEDAVLISSGKPEPSVLAQQLAFACFKSLTGKTAAVDFDENFAPHLGHLTQGGAVA